MEKSSIRAITFSGLLVALVFLMFGSYRQAEPSRSGQALALQPPSFVEAAEASDTTIASVFDDQAGIAAYTRSPSAIDLEVVRPYFRTIEIETEDYIVGSTSVPDNGEAYDAHLYVHANGWMMAYYLRDDPSTILFDWPTHEDAMNSTRLQSVLERIAVVLNIPTPSPAYYHFQHPNATDLMLAMEVIHPGGTTSGQSMELLSSSHTYYERSWMLVSHVQNCRNDAEHGRLKLDGTELAYHRHCCNTIRVSDGFLPVEQLLPSEPHVVAVSGNCGDVWGVIAVVYGGA